MPRKAAPKTPPMPSRVPSSPVTPVPPLPGMGAGIGAPIPKKGK